MYTHEKGTLNSIKKKQFTMVIDWADNSKEGRCTPVNLLLVTGTQQLEQTVTKTKFSLFIFIENVKK